MDDDSNKHAEVAAVFRRFDKNSDGTISKAELRMVIQSLCDFDEADLDSIFGQMDTNKDGVIQYEEFVRWVYSGDGKDNEFFDVCGENASSDTCRIAAALRASAAGGGFSIGNAMVDLGIDLTFDGDEPDFKDVVASLRTMSAANLREVFQKCDIGKKGFLNLGEIQKLLFPEDASRPASRITVAKVFAQMDKNRDGKVGCSEFISYIIGTKKRLTMTASDADKQHIALAFNGTDVDTDGTITLAEFHTMLHCETDDEKETAKLAFESMDSNSNGSLSIKEFAHLYGKELVKEAKGVEVVWKDVLSEEESEDDAD